MPTYNIANGVTSQGIPYATAAAIASVSSQVAETPLSVFPVATDVLNAAGTDNADDVAGNPNANVITSSGSNLKRDSSGIARQPRKRGNCAPQPTIANTHGVDISSANASINDPIIASVANNANAAPTGYYQNFANAKAANSAMNYLGYTVVNTPKGYDVDYCASKCSAKSGCLAFNIYFELDPTLDPGPDCPNPSAFANIKCSFWGTGLDASTANNRGEKRSDFDVAIAGSNAYTSYKPSGPVDGYLAPKTSTPPS